MSFVKEADDEKTIIKIEGAMSIYEAAALREACMDSLETSRSLTMDLADAADCDITGMQILLSTRMTAEAAGKLFEITAMSPAVMKAFDHAGLNSKIERGCS